MLVAGHLSGAEQGLQAFATISPGALLMAAAGGLLGAVTGWYACRRQARELSRAKEELQLGCSRLEQELQQSRAQYRDILESTPAGMVRTDPNGRILDCNPAFLALTGRASEPDVTGQPLVSFCADQASRDRLSQLFRKAPQGKVEEILLEHQGASPEWVLLSLHGAGEGSGGKFHAVLISLSERRHAVQALEQSRTLLQDRLQDVQRAYRVLEKLATGQDLDDILHWLVLDIEATNPEFRGSVLRLQPGNPPTLAHAVAPHLRADYVRAIEGVAIGPGVGSCGTAAYENRPVLSNDVGTDPNWDSFRHLIEPLGLRACWSLPIRNREGGVTGTLAVYSTRSRSPESGEFSRLEAAAHAAGVAIEMDQRLRRERDLSEQLLHAQKMEAVGRLAGGIAHDFNNLLTVILGHAQLLSGLPLPAEAGASLREIHSASERAAVLVRQLLTFSRRQSTHAVPVELNQLVQRMQQMLQRVVGENIELETRLCQDAVWMKADSIQLEQILVNLVLNARDAMPEGGKILLQTDTETETGASFARLRVRDTGHGMDQETVSRIFEPFFTTKAPGQGTGLGLAAVYAAVQQNAGQIHVTSQPGRGSEFELRFPAIPSPARPSRPRNSMERTALRGHETILLVEDEPAVRSLLTELLSSLGYQVESAEDGPSALATAQAHPSGFDLLISDVVMPGMSGLDLAQKFRQSWPKTRILLISGYPETRGKYVLENQNLLTKPFSQAVLAERVRRTIDAPSGAEIQPPAAD